LYLILLFFGILTLYFENARTNALNGYLALLLNIIISCLGIIVLSQFIYISHKKITENALKNEFNEPILSCWVYEEEEWKNYLRSAYYESTIKNFLRNPLLIIIYCLIATLLLYFPYKENYNITSYGTVLDFLVIWLANCVVAILVYLKSIDITIRAEENDSRREWRRFIAFSPNGFYYMRHFYSFKSIDIKPYFKVKNAKLENNVTKYGFTQNLMRLELTMYYVWHFKRSFNLDILIPHSKIEEVTRILNEYPKQYTELTKLDFTLMHDPVIVLEH